jgi:hypothetical protein
MMSERMAILFTIYEFNIGLQYSRARAECHALANVATDAKLKL